MADINKLRKYEMQEIIDFYYFIEDFGHIFYGDNSELDEGFNMILKGIETIKDIQDKYYSH